MCGQILVKLPAIKFHENRFCSSVVVTFKQADIFSDDNWRILPNFIANVPNPSKFVLFKNDAYTCLLPSNRVAEFCIIEPIGLHVIY
jgi:hypothetical protein